MSNSTILLQPSNTPLLNRYPEQDADATWLSQQRVGFLLHDPRVGKTPIACVAAARAGAETVCVITRAIARTQWERELAKWAPGVRCAVESYEKVSKGWIPPWRPDVLILDEGQRIKSPTAKRTRAIYGAAMTRAGGIAEGVPCLWVLSGTLAPNHIGETWTHLRAMGRTDLRYNDFLEHYTKVWWGDYGPVVQGVNPEHLPEFIQMLKPISRRRRFPEIAPHLPKMQWSTLAIDLPPKHLAEVACGPDMDKLRDALALADPNDYDAILRQAAPHLSTQRALLGRLKAPLVAEAVRDLLESGVEKVVVMAWHQMACKLLAEDLKTELCILGPTPNKKRVEYIDRFQTGKEPVIVCQIETAGEAIALHAARHLVICESPWSFGTMQQAVNRIVTPDRLLPPEIILCTVPGTIDEVVTRAIKRKGEMAATLDALAA